MITINRRHAIVQAIACSVAAVATAPAIAQTPGPTAIPLDQLFRPAQYSLLTLSPNGRFLAATAPVNERRNLVVIDMEAKKASVLTGMRAVDILSILWANDDRLLYTTGDIQGKDDRTDGGLFAIDRDGKNAATLVQPIAGGPSTLNFVARISRVVGRVPGSSDEVFVSANDRAADSQDIYRMNIQNGRKTLVSVTSPGKVLTWVRDGKNEPRAALSMDMDAKRWWFSYRAEGATQWRTLAQWNEQLKDVVIPYAFDPADPKSMYVLSNVGRETLAFFRYDPEAGKLGEMVVGSDRYDLGSFRLIGNPLGEGGRLLFGGSDEQPGKLIGVRFQGDRETTVWFDDEARRLQAAIDQALPGRVNLFDPTRSVSLVRSYSSTEPGQWLLFDKDKRRLEDTGVRAMPWIDPKQMAEKTYVTYAARDGMKIGAYLTLPRSWKSGAPVPFVVLPHGGPWAKDNWQYDPEAQFLANRGFAVLQPNFRGSTGYGAQHLRASYKQWGGTMTDDIIDGVEWAIREGYADKDRVGSYGASYGGLATLSVLVKRPELFKWGINYVGVTDLAVHQDSQPAQRFGDFATLAKAINGDQRADPALFQAQSPTRHVAKLAAPVFHAYGGSDRNVDIANGNEIRSVMDKAGKPYEWMFVGDEAHGYRQTKNVLEFYGRFEKFIQKHTPGAK